MSDEHSLTEAGEAIRALTAVQAMLADPVDGETGRVIDALTALEAARTARNHIANLITSLTERALNKGASFGSLGFPFDDPYD